MPAIPLQPHHVERPWGRTRLPECFARTDACAPIGEVWFSGDDPRGELLVKYLFTSQRLSIQVHPDDDAARERGLPRGKSEAWYLLEAEPDAVIGLGLKAAVSGDTLRAAACDGGIEHMIDWRPVQADEFIYSPAGTIHAIGAGLSVIEIQQNLDVTYRLYDYGRPRELHLDDAMAVADRAPFAASFIAYHRDKGRQILIEGAAFVVERWTFPGRAIIRSTDDQVQLIPIRAGGTVDGHPLDPGTVWRIAKSATLEPDRSLDVLVAYPGSKVRDDILNSGAE